MINLNLKNVRAIDDGYVFEMIDDSFGYLFVDLGLIIICRG